MASPYKIPKKKQPTDADSTHVHLRSPLSRLHTPPPQLKGYGDESSSGGGSRMHAGNSHGSSTDRQRAPCKPLFRDVVKSLLGLNSPNTGAGLTANHRAAGRSTSQSQVGQRAEARLASNGWRPKRASDRLLQPKVASERPSPPQKKKMDQSSGLSLSSSEIISVATGDSLAKLRGEEHAGSRSPLAPEVRGWRRAEPDRDVREEKASPDRRRSLDRAAWMRSSELKKDEREMERRRWREFREGTTNQLPRRRRTHRLSPAEPIVLSSEEDEEEEEEEEGDASQSGGPADQSQLCVHKAPPSFLQLEFSSLHAGLTHAFAAGAMMVTEDGVTLPLTVSGAGQGAEPGDVTVVASQVRGYGIWDGGVAQGGTLLDGCKDPAPSLLFLWVTDAQANLLHRELSALQSSAPSGPPCSFLLLVLKEQLQELQAALLASLLDMEEYKKGRSFSSSSSHPSPPCHGLTSPLDWTDGLLLLHTCPPPLDQHLLTLLGHSAEESSPVRRSQRSKRSSLSSSGLQQLPTRLIQYPAPPSKGRISVTKEDLACLDAGEFLNDVIIDFYLKYLLLEGVVGPVAERSHVFSSFFFKQLSRRRAAGEDDAPSVPDRHMRHQRVKTWTRHVDIFTKDFLFVPVNQESHWFLVVVCFPGLEKLQYEEPTGGSERAAGKPPLSLRPPECTELGCRSPRWKKRPCVLVMDSLKLSYHDNVCRLLRDYLQVEWEVRRRTPRLFTADTVRSCRCRVPQQDNSSDCGLYLLQYAESFLQNPVVHFELPVCLDNWFPRQRVRQKREEIRGLIMKMYDSQRNENVQ